MVNGGGSGATNSGNRVCVDPQLQLKIEEEKERALNSESTDRVNPEVCNIWQRLLEKIHYLVDELTSSHSGCRVHFAHAEQVMMTEQQTWQERLAARKGPS